MKSGSSLTWRLMLGLVLFCSLVRDVRSQDISSSDGRAVTSLPGVVGEDREPFPQTQLAPQMIEDLSRAGWKTAADGGLERLAGREKGFIPPSYLKFARISRREGFLVYDVSWDVVPTGMLAPILEGLWTFVSAARTSPEQAGKTIAAWGLPPVIDGHNLLNPDGTATYFGLMLHFLYAANPEAVQRVGVQRLSQALDLLDHAYVQAFDRQAPDIAKTDIDRARLMLFASPRLGEMAMSIKPFQDLGAQFAGYKALLEDERDSAVRAGDGIRRDDSDRALATLNTLGRQRYHENFPLPSQSVPPPPSDASLVRPAYAPLASGLPQLLRVLDRINGKPLSPDQQENLIKSFPMGELVWRMGVQDLWRQGLTGKGVKVAVIDEGIGPNPELDGAVKGRTNLTAQRGEAVVGKHATHVAGIIHALAPDAEIRGYTTLIDGGNGALDEIAAPLIAEAVDRAVADGNTIINLSLHTSASPSDVLARKVEQYARQGVIFVIAAGNNRDKGNVQAPSVAPNAISVGAMDVAGRMADFSSYGSSFDPRLLVHVVKSVFMAPGTNINSTLPSSMPNRPKYGLMDGTSMATPALAGVSSLLVQAASFSADPVEISRRVRDALAAGSTPMELDVLPPNVPFDQVFYVVHPLSALDALRRQQSPATVDVVKSQPGRS